MKPNFLKIAALLAASLNVAYGDGTIWFANNGSTRVGSCLLPLAPGAFSFGVFVISSNGTETLVLPLGTNLATSGLISAANPQAYPIPGTTEGQVVSLQIRGWESGFGTDWQAAYSNGLFAATPVKQFTLGPAAGPGTIIWSSSDPNRFGSFDLSFCSEFHPNFFVFDHRKTVAEGTSGVTHVTFIVSLRSGLNGPTSYPKLVNFATQSGTAIAGEDFMPTNGTLSFAYGETSQKITVTVTADPTPEPDEEFTVALSNPVNAFLEGGGGTCLITEARVIEVRIDAADAAVTFQSSVGRRYAVEFTTDWATWMTVGGAGDITGVGGSMTIRDLGAGHLAARFYRIRVLPQ